MNRRRFLMGAGASVAGATLLRPAAASAQGHHLPKGGLNIHLLDNQQYADIDRAAEAARQLETPFFRAGWCPPGTGFDSFISKVTKVHEVTGGRFVFVAGRADELWNLDNVIMQMRPYQSLICGIEGPNEWNLSGRPNWKQELSDYTKALYAKVRAGRAFTYTYVVAPGLAFPKDWGPIFGDYSAYVDLANLHFYQPAYQVDTRYLKASCDGAKAVAPGKPLIATETGAQIGDEIVSPSGYAPTEADQAWCYRTMMPYLGGEGVHYAFGYQLLNWVKRYDSDTSRENQFGAFRKDWSRKPLADEFLLLNRRSAPGNWLTF